MKKNLFSFLLSLFILSFVNAQSKISFEESEGYTIGTLNGQKGWTVWGVAVPAMVQVSTQFPTDGTNSFVMVSDGNYTEQIMGVEKTIKAFQKTEISFDLRLQTLDGSDQSIDLYDSAYNLIASFYFDYQGNIYAFDGADYKNVGNWTNNALYKVKYLVDFDTNTVRYSLNATELLTGSISGASSLDVIDFTTDNFATGYVVDNIQIINKATQGTDDGAKKAKVKLYPNPTSDILNVEISEKVTAIEVYDMVGQLVKSGKDGSKSLNLTSLQKGVYVVKVVTESYTHTEKLIKN